MKPEAEGETLKFYDDGWDDGFEYTWKVEDHPARKSIRPTRDGLIRKKVHTLIVNGVETSLRAIRCNAVRRKGKIWEFRGTRNFDQYSFRDTQDALNRDEAREFLINKFRNLRIMDAGSVKVVVKEIGNGWLVDFNGTEFFAKDRDGVIHLMRTLARDYRKSMYGDVLFIVHWPKEHPVYENFHDSVKTDGCAFRLANTSNEDGWD